MRMRTFISANVIALLGAGVIATWPTALRAAEANDDYMIVDANTDFAPLSQGKKFNEERLSTFVKTALKDLPQGTRLRISLRGAYLNHPASDGWNLFVRSVVPLNAAGRADGDELWYDGREYEQFVVRVVPWKDGVRDGLEVDSSGGARKETPWKNGRIEGLGRTFFPAESSGTARPGETANATTGNVVQAETTYVDGQPNGPARVYDPQGNLVREVTMKDGKRVGTMTEYWPSGKPRKVVPYKDGMAQGLAREYYPSGTLKAEVPWVNDMMQGELKVYRENGDLVDTTYWFDGDRVTQEEYLRKTGGK